jgi:hypothetical protein
MDLGDAEEGRSRVVREGKTRLAPLDDSTIMPGGAGARIQTSTSMSTRC